MGAFDDVEQHHIFSLVPDGEISQAFAECWAPATLITGPLGSGKTGTACGKAFDVICDMPVDKYGVRRSRGLVIRNAENDLRGTTIKDWLSVVPLHLGEFRSTSPITHTLDFDGDDGIPVHAEVIFLPLDDIQAIKKLRGYQLTWLWIDEAKEIPQEIVNMAFGRLGRYPRRQDMPVDPDYPDEDPYWYGGFLTTNAMDDDHWLYKLHEDPTPEQQEQWETFWQPGGVIRDHATGKWVPNPLAENLKNLPPGYYRRQIGLSADDDHIKINLGNQVGFTIEGVPCWREFNHDVHLFQEDLFDDTAVIYGGVDYGRTPACALFHEKAGGYDFFREFVTIDMGAPLFAGKLRRFIMAEYGVSPENVFLTGDPSGTSKKDTSETTAEAALRAEGFKIRSSPIPNQNLFARRKAMIDPLTRLRSDGKPAIRISKPGCPMLAKAGAGKFYYKKLQVTGDAKYHELPEKNEWSHIAEAAEYGLSGRGEGIVHTTKAKKSRSNARRGSFLGAR